MSRTVGALPKWRLAIAVLASLGAFAVTRLLFPGWSTGSPLLAVAREIVLLLLVGGVLFYVICFEQIDPATLGLRRPRLSSLGWGLVGAVVMVVVDVAVVVALGMFHIRQDTQTLARLAGMGLPLIVLVALTAAITEELIFRSILVDHLAGLTNSQWMAAIGSILLFCAAHLSGWSPTQLFFVAPSGAILTLLFLWKRDIAACMVAHFLVDAVGLMAAAASLPR